MSEDHNTAAQEAAQQEQALVAMIESAIFGSGIIRLEAEVMSLGTTETKSVWLNIRWPDFEDEEMITARTSNFLRGLAPEQVSVADANFARARAMIEQLAVGPFPKWLQTALPKELVTHKGVKELRPDTSKLRVGRAVVQALYLRYVELYNRFHSLGLE